MREYIYDSTREYNYNSIMRYWYTYQTFFFI